MIISINNPILQRQFKTSDYKLSRIPDHIPEHIPDYIPDYIPDRIPDHIPLYIPDLRSRLYFLNPLALPQGGDHSKRSNSIVS